MVLVVIINPLRYNKSMIHYVRLPLEGTANTRDLGGYPTKDGHSTKWHVFLRSDDVVDLTARDFQFLNDYGLKTVIDLRSSSELAMRHNPFTQHHEVDYINVSLFENASPQSMADLPKSSLNSMYIEILRHQKNQIKQVMETIAKAKAGTILFHCAAGKDRTGVISMLLLGLAKVPNRDIVSNYEVSFTNLKRTAFFHANKTAISNMMLSTNTSMEDTLIYLRENYTNVEKYLLSTGLTQANIDLIKARFIEEDPSCVK